jgi:hypothetical protein
MTTERNKPGMNAVLVLVIISSPFLAACSDIGPRNMTAEEAAFASTNPISEAAHEQR